MNLQGLFTQHLNEDEIDWKNEKSWNIKEVLPIELFVEKSWTNTYYIVKAPSMKIKYETWEDLNLRDVVDISQYDFINGEARWTSYTLEDIKKWEEKNKDRITINYSKLK